MREEEEEEGEKMSNSITILFLFCSLQLYNRQITIFQCPVIVVMTKPSLLVKPKKSAWSSRREESEVR